MNTLLKEKLQILAEDELLLNAIKEVFMERINLEKPQVGSADNDKLLGEKYRAYEKSCEIIDKTFTDLKSYKVIKKSPPGFNKER